MKINPLAVAWMLLAVVAQAADLPADVRAPIERFAVRGPLPPPDAAVSELKFRDFVRLPVGPRGLELSARLTSLVGQRVRLVGYMARQSTPTPGLLVLSPLPVELGDEDESLSDDLPVTATFVHLAAGQAEVAVPHLPGLLQFTGILQVGPSGEADGHVSSFRLLLDTPDSVALASLAAALR